MLALFPQRACRPLSARLAPVVAVALLATGAMRLWARGPEPIARIELASFGYQEFPAQVLASGASVLSLHYVDDHHLLLTFNKRRLMPRIPDDPPDDNDRNVDAVLVELPSGRVVARVSWRMHDIGQYLWSLGHGQFLLRARNRLVTISPLANLHSGNPFEEHSLLASSRTIGAIFVSPDAKLLTVETVDSAPAEKRKPSPRTRAFAAAAAAADADESAPPPPVDPVQINFFRLIERTETGVPLAQSAGTVRARALSLIPADAAGFISVLDQGHHHYAFDFREHTGKVNELAPFDSTCAPAPLLVSSSEFIAFGCRNGGQMQMIGGFNLHGEEMWEQMLSPYVNPTLALAPAVGRVALSRIVTTAAAPAEKTGTLARGGGILPSASAPVAEQIESQTVNVLQMESGRQIFSLTCTPILRAGGNFTLSEDGSELAIVRGGAIEIYRLPSLSAKEKEVVERASRYAPPLNSARIELDAKAVAAMEAPKAAAPASATPVATGGGSAGAMASAGGSDSSAASPPEAAGPAPSAAIQPADDSAPRKPPTLYSPGEKPAVTKDSPAPAPASAPKPN